MTLPALYELRRLWPKTRITLMVRPWVRELFEDTDLVDGLVDCDEAEGPWRRMVRNVHMMRRGGYDSILLLPNAIAPAIQAIISGIPERMGYATDGREPLLSRSVRKSPRLRSRHQCYQYLDLLHALGLSPVDYLDDDDFHPNTSLPFGPSKRRAAVETATRFGLPLNEIIVGINPGAYYGSAKRWFPNRFAQVADALVDSHRAHILLFGSTQEERIADQIAVAMQHQATSLVGQTRLTELLHLLSQCDLIITNDSGPMHLASSLNVPLIALFGSTDVEATGPRSGRAKILRKDVACSPCLLRECPLDLRCFTQIGVEEVILAAQDSLCLYRNGRS